MTFTEIQTEILERLNLTSAEATSRVGRAINRLYGTITSSISLDTSRNELGVPATIVLGESELTFAGVEKVFRVFDTSSGRIKELKEVTLFQIREENPGTGMPTKWAVITIDADSVTIRVNTVAQTAFTIYADGLTSLPTLSGSDIPIIPKSFHDVLIEGVLKDEYQKLEKPQSAKLALDTYNQRMSDLRMFLTKSAYKDVYQGQRLDTLFGRTTSGGSGSGSSPNGGLSYVQTGLITFDRDPSAPFAITSGSAVVTNLDADTVDGIHGATLVVGPASATDNAIARFDATTGKLIQNSGITIADGASGTLSNTNSGDVTLAGTPDYITISGQVITRGLIDLAADVTGRLPFANFVAATAASRLVGRQSGSAGDFQEITPGTNLTMSGTTLDGPSAGGSTTQLQYNNGGTAFGGTSGLTWDSANSQLSSSTQYRCSVFNSAAQSIAASTATILTFDSEDHDTGTMHSTGANTGRITIPTGGAGIYLVGAATKWGSIATAGDASIYVRKNGTTAVITESNVGPTGASHRGSCHILGLISLSATDYIEVIATQTTVGAVNAGGATRDLASQFWAVKLC